MKSAFSGQLTAISMVRTVRAATAGGAGFGETQGLCGYRFDFIPLGRGSKFADRLASLQGCADVLLELWPENTLERNFRRGLLFRKLREIARWLM